MNVQSVFDEHGPRDERGCDWWRCQEQPWRDLATALAFGGGMPELPYPAEPAKTPR